MVHDGHKNIDIITAVQCYFEHSENNKTGNYGDYDALPCMKEQIRRSDCLRAPEFIQQVQEKVMKDSGKEMRILVWEMGVAVSTMKWAL